MDEVSSSLELALADVEILQSAYPDETSVVERCDAISSPAAAAAAGAGAVESKSTTSSRTSSFPLHVWLYLSETAYMQLEWTDGYPVTSNVAVILYRAKSAEEHVRLEQAVAAVRETAASCLEQGVEGGLACCAAALEAFTIATTESDFITNNNDMAAAVVQGAFVHERSKMATNSRGDPLVASAATITTTALDTSSSSTNSTSTTYNYVWMTGEPLMDRKSTFVAHLCRITHESHVQPALQQLLQSHSKYQRATHNMYAYRISEQRLVPVKTRNASFDDVNGDTPEHSTAKSRNIIWKHDNDDDGEDGAGKRLAHLLELRNEDGVLIVVSRWFGGIQLGPKRFAHITSTAQALLVTAAAAAAAALQK